MATRPIKAVRLGAAEKEVRAPLHWTVEADGLALRIVHLEAVEVFGLGTGRTVAAPAAPDIAVDIDLVMVGGQVLAPDDAVRSGYRAAGRGNVGSGCPYVRLWQW